MTRAERREVKGDEITEAIKNTRSSRQEVDQLWLMCHMCYAIFFVNSFFFKVWCRCSIMLIQTQIFLSL